MRTVSRQGPSHEGEAVELLVTVKAYPGLSTKYGEVVCVAGVRTDLAAPAFIRLFPVAFRDLPSTTRFAEYANLGLRVRKTTSDSRPESYSPYLDTVVVGATINTGPKSTWGHRWKVLGPLAGAHTMCGLQQEQARSGASLGLIRVREVLDLEIGPNEEFDARRLAIAEMSAQASLFDVRARPVLEPAPYKMKYRYRCEEPGCRTHSQTFIDWEAAEAARSWRPRYAAPGELERKLREKFLTQMCADGRDTHFFVGNQHLAPKAFLVLGVFWPPTGTRPGT